MVWKDNKHGTGEKDTHCFNCAWFQPWDFGQTPPRPQPNGPSIEEETEVVTEAVRIDPVEPGEQATTNGYCRARSVPITNLNMMVSYDGKIGYFKSNYQNSDNELLNEVEMDTSPEFWCRKWKRALYPFAWPPLESS